MSTPDLSPELRRIAFDDNEKTVCSRGLEYGFCYDTGLRYSFDWDAKEPQWVRDFDDARYVAARKEAILYRRGEP